MNIKIIKNTTTPFTELVWYANRIGQVYKVDSEDDKYYFVYHGENSEYPIGAIAKDDCVILNTRGYKKRFLCWLGFHKWVNIDTSPMPNPKAGEMICWSELHECCHCKKQEYKGMGCIV